MEIAQLNVKQAHGLRNGGRPDLAVEWVNEIDNLIEIKLKTPLRSEVRYKLMNLLGDSYHEKMHAICISTPIWALPKQANSLARKLVKLGKVLNNKKFEGMANYLFAHIAYFQKDFKKGKTLFEKVINQFPDNFDENIIGLRNYALCSAGMGDEKTFKSTINEALKKQNCWQQNWNSWMFEGISRGEMMLGNFDLAEKNLNIAWNNFFALNLTTRESKTLRQIQLTRAQLELVRLSNKFDAKTEIMCKKALELCQLAGFQRYKETITDSLNSA